MYKLAEIFERSDSVKDYVDRYFSRLKEVLDGLDRGAMEQSIAAIEAASLSGNRLYFLANGGSAAAASHLVNDYVAGTLIEGRPPLRAFCLTDNTETITALANDVGYENVFSRQLRVHLEPGDVVLLMSVSGNSENIIRAAICAKEMGAVTIGFCGFDGGRLANLCDIVLHAPTTRDEYGPVEDVFAIMVHILGTYLAMKWGKRLHH